MFCLSMRVSQVIHIVVETWHPYTKLAVKCMSTIFNFLAVSGFLCEWLCLWESNLEFGFYPISISCVGRGPVSRYQAGKLMCGNSAGTLW